MGDNNFGSAMKFALLKKFMLFPLSGLLALPLAAWQQGPLPSAPPQQQSTQSGASKPAPSPVAAPSSHPGPASSRSSDAPPSMPVDQIIQQFAARETEFKTERDNYTYTQSFLVQTIDGSGRPDGEYRLTSDIMFTTSGKRYEKVVFAPPSTLQRVSLSEQDLADLQNVQPFVLTTAELPKYDITYIGREQVDEISTYVFDVKPKRLEKNQRYFQGRIWVDDKDLEIVKTYGKAVPDIRKGGNENVFPRFETYRENIEGHYWFPTYTRADDVLRFSSGDVRIRMTVHYADYKRFGVTSRILAPVQEPKDQH